MNILLLENDEADARLIGEMLAYARESLFQVTWASSLAAGLKRLATEQVDAILLRLGLHDDRRLDGLALLGARAPHVPLILLVGAEDEPSAREGVRQGAEDYLVKWQVDSRAVVRCIETSIHRKRLQTEVRRALESAETANRKERDHIVNTGQWLHTPASLLVNISERLLDTELTSDQAKYIRIIKGSALSLLSQAGRLIDCAGERGHARATISLLAMGSRETSGIPSSPQRPGRIAPPRRRGRAEKRIARGAIRRSSAVGPTSKPTLVVHPN